MTCGSKLYQQGTPFGDQSSDAYNTVIPAATLQYAYLEHFIKPNPQLSRYILPMLCHTWRSKGHSTALRWPVDNPPLRRTVDSINAEVNKLVGPTPSPAQASSVL